MFHNIRQLIVKTVACAAFYDMVSLYAPCIIFRVSVREYPAHINKVIPFRTVVPFHRIAPCLMVSGQLHQAEVGETVSVHVNQPGFQVILPPSIFFSFNLNALLVSGYICHSIHTVLHIPRFPYLQYISRPGKPVPVQLHFPDI